MVREYTKENPLRVFTAFSGYDSQCLVHSQSTPLSRQKGYSVLSQRSEYPHILLLRLPVPPPNPSSSSSLYYWTTPVMVINHLSNNLEIRDNRYFSLYSHYSFAILISFCTFAPKMIRDLFTQIRFWSYILLEKFHLR